MAPRPLHPSPNLPNSLKTSKMLLSTLNCFLVVFDEKVLASSMQSIPTEIYGSSSVVFCGPSTLFIGQSNGELGIKKVLLKSKDSISIKEIAKGKKSSPKGAQPPKPLQLSPDLTKDY